MSHEPEASAEVKEAKPDRITVTLGPKAAVGLARIQDRAHLSKTDAVNRAITLYERLQAQLDANDIIIRNPETGESHVVLFL